jgi:1-acyl-sn-glycerol-3-phosphate acyltransferase
MSRLTDVKLIGGWVRWFDGRVGAVGVKEAVAETIKRTRSKLEVMYLGNSLKTLTEDPVIIVANHPHESDVLAILGSLPSRKDFRMIANSVLKGIGDNLDKIIIPVYVHHRMESTTGGGIKMKVFGKIHTSTKHEIEDEKSRNRESIKEASERLNKGGAVLIFPAAGSYDGAWFSGVGHMWINTKQPQNTKVVMAKIEGTAEWDYLRLIPGVSWFLPKFKVTFSPAYDWKKVESREAKETVKKMEKIYADWSDNLV